MVENHHADLPMFHEAKPNIKNEILIFVNPAMLHLRLKLADTFVLPHGTLEEDVVGVSACAASRRIQRIRNFPKKEASVAESTRMKQPRLQQHRYDVNWTLVWRWPGE
jgi:hypothetical protein